MTDAVQRFIAAEKLIDNTYLGDGVYAGFSDGMIWLHTLEGNRIALEPEVWQALQGYAKRHLERPA